MDQRARDVKDAMDFLKEGVLTKQQSALLQAAIQKEVTTLAQEHPKSFAGAMKAVGGVADVLNYVPGIIEMVPGLAIQAGASLGEKIKNRSWAAPGPDVFSMQDVKRALNPADLTPATDTTEYLKRAGVPQPLAAAIGLPTSMAVGAYGSGKVAKGIQKFMGGAGEILPSTAREAGLLKKANIEKMLQQSTVAEPMSLANLFSNPLKEVTRVIGERGYARGMRNLDRPAMQAGQNPISPYLKNAGIAGDEEDILAGVRQVLDEGEKKASGVEKKILDIADQGTVDQPRMRSDILDPTLGELHNVKQTPGGRIQAGDALNDIQDVYKTEAETLNPAINNAPPWRKVKPKTLGQALEGFDKEGQAIRRPIEMSPLEPNIPPAPVEDVPYTLRDLFAGKKTAQGFARNLRAYADPKTILQTTGPGSAEVTKASQGLKGKAYKDIAKRFREATEDIADELNPGLGKELFDANAQQASALTAEQLAEQAANQVGRAKGVWNSIKPNGTWMLTKPSLEMLRRPGAFSEPIRAGMVRASQPTDYELLQMELDAIRRGGQ
jgi:hypothetical protein